MMPEFMIESSEGYESVDIIDELEYEREYSAWLDLMEQKESWWEAIEREIAAHCD